ncbi:MAG TPA: hypothetical protein DD435_04460 [Cyanobacteria bacterium UBA8530]|nr:hypothetical protein [Cyanobacteria bacterium UBA8530]
MKGYRKRIALLLLASSLTVIGCGLSNPLESFREGATISPQDSATYTEQRRKKGTPAPTIAPSIAPTSVPSIAPTFDPILDPIADPDPIPTAASLYFLYVSTTGNDSNSGTQASPLRTISAAAGKAKPSTTILIAGGTYYEQVVTKVAGAAGQEIIFKSYNGTAVIDGSKLSWAINGNQNQGLFEFRHPYVRLNGLKITNSKNSGVVFSADNVTVNGCEVSQIQHHAISTHTSYQTNAPDSYRKNIRNVTISNNNVHHAVLGNNGQAISLIADGFTVSGNSVHDIQKEGIDIWLGSKHGAVFGNTVYNCTTSTGMFVDGASYVRIYNNRSYNNRHGIVISSEASNYTTHHLWVYDNCFYDNREQGFAIWDPNTGPTNILIANNTIVSNPVGLAFSGSSLSAEAMNNLIYAPQKAVANGSSNSSINVHDNTTITGLTGFVGASSKNFALASGSPAINKGKAIPTFSDDQGRTFSVTKDFAGRTRVVNGYPDAGAHEFQ